MTDQVSRWRGRNAAKDDLRAEIWRTLEREGAAMGNPWSTIPDFVGAREAAERLSGLPFWQPARIVKTNPDRAQGWVRLLALQAGKTVYTPVPELTADFPFLRLAPERLRQQAIAFEDVMYSAGALRHGERVHFEAMEAMDICVVGSVAVGSNGGRTGKGAGFADLEMGIFRELGLLPADTPVVTTVSDWQVVEGSRVPLEAHDTPLDWVVTPTRTLQTKTTVKRPRKLDWSAVREDQFAAIPFLRALQKRLS